MCWVNRLYDCINYDGPQEQYSVIYCGTVVHLQTSYIYTYKLRYNAVRFIKILHTALRCEFRRASLSPSLSLSGTYLSLRHLSLYIYIYITISIFIYLFIFISIYLYIYIKNENALINNLIPYHGNKHTKELQLAGKLLQLGYMRIHQIVIYWRQWQDRSVYICINADTSSRVMPVTSTVKTDECEHWLWWMPRD